MHENRSKLVTRGFLGMLNSILALELPGGAQGRLCRGVRGFIPGGKSHSPCKWLQNRYSGVFGDAEFNSGIGISGALRGGRVGVRGGRIGTGIFLEPYNPIYGDFSGEKSKKIVKYQILGY